MSSIKKLAGQTIWYGGSSIAAKFINYLLTPYLTYNLANTSDYGKMGIIYSAIPIFNIIFTYGFETAYFRFASKAENRDTIYSTASLSLFFSTILFTTEKSAQENLIEEGIVQEKIHFVGNIMIDALREIEPTINVALLKNFDCTPFSYGVVTLHRTENVDDKNRFASLWQAVCHVSEQTPLLFPVHPRTREKIADFGLQAAPDTLRLIAPVGYRDMLALEKYAQFFMTDSGGVQEETTIFGVPCLTTRTETERPVTVSQGTNEVVGVAYQGIVQAVDCVLAGQWKKGNIPEKWDGKTAERIVKILLDS